MPGLNLSDAGLLSLPVLSFVEQDECRMQFLEKLVFHCINGWGLRMPRVTLLGLQPGFNEDGGPVTPADALPESPQIGYERKLLVQDIYVRMRVGCGYSAIYDQLQIQIWAAVRRFLYRFLKAFFNGNSNNAGEMAGLDQIIWPTQKLLPNDTTNFGLSSADLTRVVGKVKCDRTRGPIIIVVSPLGWVNILLAHYLAGADPEIAFMEFQDGNDYSAMQPVMTFDGIPVFMSDHVRNDKLVGGEPTGTTVYVFQLGPGGVYAVTDCPEGRPIMTLRESLDQALSNFCCRLEWSVTLVLEAIGGAASLDFRPRPETL